MNSTIDSNNRPTENAKTVIADIETTAITYDDSGLMIIPEKVHVLCARDVERGITYDFGPDYEDIERGVRWLERADTVIFHNGRTFDEVVLTYHFNFNTRNCVDSVVLCRLFYSNVKEEEDFEHFRAGASRSDDDPLKFDGELIGSHSLEAWGLRLKTPRPKGDYTGLMKKMFPGVDPWADYNLHMLEYCKQDVYTLEGLWLERLHPRTLIAKQESAIAIEHYLVELMEEVKRSGIRFDSDRAHKLADELETRLEQVGAEIIKEFPARLEPTKWVHRPIPLGEPDLTDEERTALDRCRSLKTPEMVDTYNELMNNRGPKQQLTDLMHRFSKNKIYRPRFNLPEGYLREEWGDVSMPKVNRVVRDKEKNELYRVVKDSPFCKAEMTEINPGSRIQLIRRLLEIGWVPQEFTESNNPKLDEAELAKLEEELPAAKNIALYLLIQKRLSALKTGDKAWLNLVSPKGFIHPTIRPCSTVTFRGSHADPNISQVPSVRSVKVRDEHGNVVHKTDDNGNPILKDGEPVAEMRPGIGEEGKWGWDSRECFTVPDGWVMVGSDLAGIELRAWAHYLWPYDHGRLADIILNKDVHEENRIILGFADRRKAKEWLYACVPMDTQALTKEGWKTYDQLRVGELIMTYNPDTREKEWQPLLELVKYDDAEIMEISHTKGFNVRCTPNHRWFTRRRTGSKTRYYVDEVVTTEELTSEHAIIQNAPLADHCKDGASLDFECEKYGPDWTSKILEASSLSRSAFLLGFLLADGYREQDGSWAWSQLRGPIAEGAIVASYLESDKAVRITDIDTSVNPMIRARLSKKSFVTGQRLKSRRAHNAPVWCPRTKNGSWVMRQGNTITITGNTMYGGGDEKLGFIIDKTASIDKQKQLGRASRARFMAGMTGYEELNEKLMSAVRRGYIEGLDGRRCPVRKQHAALNTLLQSAGAIISKYWILFTMQIIETEHDLKWGYDKDFTLMIYSHDELDFACRPEHAEKIADACRRGAKQTQDFLKFRLPIDVGIMPGKNWAECH
ncbi:MAG: DNA polymerase [Betaproteobacteria bacterium]